MKTEILNPVTFNTASRQDNNMRGKRVELHIHTHYSRMDGLIQICELIDTLKSWGHKACAITDFNEVNGFTSFNSFCKRGGIKPLFGMECNMIEEVSKQKNYIILLVKNQTGLKNLYKLLSISSLKNYNNSREDIVKYSEGLLIGSSCENSEILKLIYNSASDDIIVEKLGFYDYIELPPVDNCKPIINADNNIISEYDIRKMNMRLFNLCKKNNKIIVASSNAHYMNPEDKICRAIILNAFENETPDLYLRTTDEMLFEFSYLGAENAYAIVVDNTNKIADMIENIKLTSDDFYPLIIENSEKILSNIVYEKAYKIYGNILPEIVSQRINKEWGIIIENKLSGLFMTANKIVKKANDDNIIVSSCSSIASSLVAFLADITNINPLPPHYNCPQCKKTIFFEDSIVGICLPDKLCNACNSLFTKDGYNLKSEFFFANGKPYLGLLFPEKSSHIIHTFVEELFGNGNVYTAGDISKIEHDEAEILVNRYIEEKKMNFDTEGKKIIIEKCFGIKKRRV